MVGNDMQKEGENAVYWLKIKAELQLRIVDANAVVRKALEREAARDGLTVEQWCSDVVLGMLSACHEANGGVELEGGCA